MKKSKGFTLVELIIVIVIVGILSIVAVPIYRGYTKKAIATEAKTLLGSIATSQKVYYAEFGMFIPTGGTIGYFKELDIDARANKYFPDYSSTANNTGTKTFTAIVVGDNASAASGITLQMIGSEEGTTTTLSTGLD